MASSQATSPCRSHGVSFELGTLVQVFDRRVAGGLLGGISDGGHVRHGSVLILRVGRGPGVVGQRGGQCRVVLRLPDGSIIAYRALSAVWAPSHVLRRIGLLLHGAISAVGEGVGETHETSGLRCLLHTTSEMNHSNLNQ